MIVAQRHAMEDAEFWSLNPVVLEGDAGRYALAHPAPHDSRRANCRQNDGPAADDAGGGLTHGAHHHRFCRSILRTTWCRIRKFTDRKSRISTNRMSVPQLAGFFPGVKPEDLPDGEAWAIEKIELITHNGTHLDAPYHFASTMNHGERAITIDEVPLDWCFQPGVKLDFRHFSDGYVVTADDVKKELERIGHGPSTARHRGNQHQRRKALRPRDYVSALRHGLCATMYLLERGVRLTGTDGGAGLPPSCTPPRTTPGTPIPALSGKVTRRTRHRLLSPREAAQSRGAAGDGFQIACFP